MRIALRGVSTSIPKAAVAAKAPPTLMIAALEHLDALAQVIVMAGVTASTSKWHEMRDLELASQKIFGSGGAMAMLRKAWHHSNKVLKPRHAGERISAFARRKAA